MKTSSLLLSSLAVVATACGGGSKKDPPLVDAPGMPVDMAPLPCTAESTLSSIVNPFFDYTADTDTMTAGNQESWYVGYDLNADPLTDWLNIELYEGAPPTYTTLNFPATPFTVMLTGAELEYATCSTCILLQTNVDIENTPEGGPLAYSDDYMATAGSITFTTLTATQATGTLNNVTFTQMDFSDAGQMPSASGCTATAATLTFDAMMQPMARKNGKRVLSARIKR
jgi:hypothetical protein